MEIIINNKKFTFNDDMRWGILEAIELHPQDAKVIKAFIKEVLIPTPSAKEFFNFRQSDVFSIMEKFGQFQKETVTDYKKKLSRS